MPRVFQAKSLVLLAGLVLSISAHAVVQAGAQLPLKSIDGQVFKSGDQKRVKFRVATPEDPADADTPIGRLAGCTIEGDSAYNPRTGRLYVKRPVLTCAPDTKVGAAFLGGSINGQLSEAGLEGIPLECPKPKECTVGALKKNSEAAFTVTETMGGGD